MKTNHQIIRKMVLIGSLGLQMLILIVGGTWLGKQLDSFWQTKPTFTLIGVLVGVLLGLVSAIYTLVRMTKD